MKPANVLKIATPEGIHFSIPLASPLLRFFAWIIDFCSVFFLISFISTLISPLATFAPDTASALLIFAGFIVYIGYAMVLEWRWQGQTIGKKLFRLRVMDSRGLKLQINQIIIRNLFRVVDSLPFAYLLGGAAAFFSPHSQRLGDMIANTVVVHTQKKEHPDLGQIRDQKYNSLYQHPHLIGLLRQRVSPIEAEIGLRAILRRAELEDQARLTLFDKIADYYQQKVSFPEETLYGISKEQFVRNVVEVLYK